MFLSSADTVPDMAVERSLGNRSGHAHAHAGRHDGRENDYEKGVVL